MFYICNMLKLVRPEVGKIGRSRLSRACIMLACFGLAFVVLLWVSPDSYLHSMNDRYDSGWFMTCGRAWMLGLRPYVDFSDSKGPVLWLIYGMGYLISRTDYLGVFWISCIFYALTYYVCYLAARVFFTRSTVCFAIAALMSLAWFNPLFFNEVRAEDFCHLPIMIQLYVLCRVFYGKRSVGMRQLFFLSFAIGLCLTFVLLIKFNIATMSLCFVLLLLYGFRRSMRSILVVLSGFVVGAVVVAVPIAALLAGQRCFGAFVHEYFVLTWQTTHMSLSPLKLINMALNGMLRWHPLVVLGVAVAVVGCVFFSLSVKTCRWLSIVCLVSFLGITSLSSWQMHHFSAMSFLYFFLLVALLLGVQNFFTRVRCLVLVVASVVAALVCAVEQNFVSLNHHENLFVFDNDSKREYYFIAHAIDQLENPMLLYWSAADIGFGTLAQALPACRYWAKQSGATKEMMAMQESCVQNQKADFVIIHYREKNTRGSMLQKAGYAPIVCDIEDPQYALYCGPNVKRARLKTSAETY